MVRSRPFSRSGRSGDRLREGLASLPPGLLPPGRLVVPQGGRRPRYWLADDPAGPATWEELHRLRRTSGLWPLFLEGLRESGPDADRPWVLGEVHPDGSGDPARHDPHAVLERWWTGLTGEEEGEDGELQEELLAPLGRAWPGPASPGRGHVPDAQDPPADVVAGVRELVAARPAARLGLVPAARGADALTALGWTGPVNHAGTGEIAAVVRSWEERFGAVVVVVGFATLTLAVAAPPHPASAVVVAAEHYAFCPDNVQGAGSVAEYADGVRQARMWDFWWD